MSKTVSKLCLVERDEAPELPELSDKLRLQLAEVAGAAPEGLLVNERGRWPAGDPPAPEHHRTRGRGGRGPPAGRSPASGAQRRQGDRGCRPAYELFASTELLDACSA